MGGFLIMFPNLSLELALVLVKSGSKVESPSPGNLLPKTFSSPNLLFH